MSECAFRMGQTWSEQILTVGCILLGTAMAEDGVEMTWVIDCCWLLTALGY